MNADTVFFATTPPFIDIVGTNAIRLDFNGESWKATPRAHVINNRRHLIENISGSRSCEYIENCAEFGDLVFSGGEFVMSFCVRSQQVGRTDKTDLMKWVAKRTHSNHSYTISCH